MNLFDISKLENELSDLEKQTMQDGFWNDSKKSSIILQKIKTLKNKVETYNKLNIELNNLIEMSDLVMQELDSQAFANQDISEQNSEQDDSLIKDILLGTQKILNVSEMSKHPSIKSIAFIIIFFFIFPISIYPFLLNYNILFYIFL